MAPIFPFHGVRCIQPVDKDGNAAPYVLCEECAIKAGIDPYAFSTYSVIHTWQEPDAEFSCDECLVKL